jgi:hypothetical protein
MTLFSGKSRKEREKERERHLEEEQTREARARLVRGTSIPKDKVYLWDLGRDPHQAPGPVPAPYAANPRRFPVERPNITQSAFQALLRKKARAQADAQPDEPSAKRRKVHP